MDPKNPNTKKTQIPSGLPILDDEKVKTHTMQGDLEKLKSSIEQQKQGQVMQGVEDKDKTVSLKINQEQENKFKEGVTSGIDPSILDKFRKPKNLKTQIEDTKIDLAKFKEKTSGSADIKNEDFKQKQEVGSQEQIPEILNSNLIESETKEDQTQNKINVNIPENSNKKSIIIALISFVLVVILSLLYYFFFFENEKTPTKEEKTETPEIIKVPETRPAKEEVRRTEVKKEEVEIKEPQIPQALFNIKQTVVTEIPGLDSAEMIKNLFSDSLALSGNGVIRRHLFKLSNKKEKRILKTKEALLLLGVKLPKETLSNMSDVELVSYKVGKILRFGIISEIKNKEIVLSEIENYDTKKLIKELRQIFMGELITIPDLAKFSRNTYLDFEKMYINLPSPDLSLDVAISDKYLIISTSKDMVFASIMQVR